MIKKADVTDWKHNPVTERLFMILKEAKSLKQEEILCRLETVDKVALNTAFIQGFIKAVNLVLDAELHDEEVQDDNIPSGSTDLN